MCLPNVYGIAQSLEMVLEDELFALMSLPAKGDGASPATKQAIKVNLPPKISYQGVPYCLHCLKESM